jgi:DNA-binding XRE family transcriptional regulator
VGKWLILPVLRNEIYEQFGRLVAEQRKRTELSQAALGQTLGLSRASIANIEGGKQAVQLHLIFKIASVLQIDIQELIPKLGNRGKSLQVTDWLNRIEESATTIPR